MLHSVGCGGLSPAVNDFMSTPYHQEITERATGQIFSVITRVDSVALG